MLLERLRHITAHRRNAETLCAGIAHHGFDQSASNPAPADFGRNNGMLGSPEITLLRPR